MRAVRAVGVVVLGLWLAGCGSEPPAPAPMATGEGSPPPVLAEPVAPGADADALQQRADQAMREQRLFAPAGDNAFEYFLALHERLPGQGATATALVQLQPYLTLGIEHALSAANAAEARRLVELLARADAQAAALPRLRGALDELDTRLAAEAQREAEREAALAARAAAVAAPVATPAAPAPPPAAATVATAPVTAPVPTPVVAPAPVPVPPAPAAAPPPAGRGVATAPSLPRLLVDAQPRYPLPALRNRIEGQVEVAFSVLADGSVRDVRLVDAQPSGMFDASAMAVAQRWRFEATGREHRMRRVVNYRLPAGT